MKIRIILFSLVVISLATTSVWAQNRGGKKQPETTFVRITTTDEASNPVAGATIYSENGRKAMRSDASGQLKIRIERNSLLRIEAEEYLSQTVMIDNQSDVKVVLVKAPYKASERDNVDVAFGKLAERNLLSAVNKIDMEQMRGRLYRQDWNIYVSANSLGVFGSGDIRGTGNTVVIDGLVKDEGNLSLSDYILADEIAEITVLKDGVSRLLYGNVGNGGVINITTKRGVAGKNYLNVHYESSWGRPQSMPEYLGASDYMTLYNEACRNDNVAERYSEQDILHTRLGFDPVQFPDIDFYSNDFIRNFKNTQAAYVETGGGNRIASYHFNMGWNNSRSILDLGEGQNQKSNTFRLRGNVDVKVTDWLKARVDMAVVYAGSYAAKGNYWDMAATRRPNQTALLIPIDRIVESDREIVDEARQKRSLIADKYLLAGDQVYTSNLYGDMFLAGYSRGVSRMANINIGFDVNLKGITRGLKFRTYAGIDNNNTYLISQNNTYAVYTPSYTITEGEGPDAIAITKVGENNFVGSQSIGSVDMNRKMAWYNILSWERTFNDRHALSATAVSNMSSYVTQGQIYARNRLNYGLRANYMLDGKYVAEVDWSLIASPFLPAANRWGLAGAYALGWIVSEEEFMKDSPFKYLKIKTSYSDMLFDPDSYNLSRDTYKKGSNYIYNDGSGRNNLIAVTLGNPDLSFGHIREINAGVEFALLNGAFSGELNYFNRRKSGMITTLTSNYYSFLGGSDFIPAEHYEINSGNGFEFALAWHKWFDRDWAVDLNGGVVYLENRKTRVAENNYGAGYEYYQQQGKSVTALWGWVADGLYTQQEIDLINDPTDTSIAKPAFGTVAAGDIKYVDLNDDNIIDDWDKKVIGNSRASFDYNLSIGVRYRNLTLYALMRVQTGSSQFFNNAYYWVYGERKYPSYITGRWAYDPERGIDTRQSATYPRLTTLGNTHNFRNSTYWLAATDYFKIPVMQLTYTLPERAAAKLAMHEPNIYVRVNNLWTVARNKDKMMLNVAAEPNYTWFAIGLKANF